MNYSLQYLQTSVHTLSDGTYFTILQTDVLLIKTDGTKLKR
jgi:hypothetical protein